MNKLLVFTAPSGAGKTTIVRHLLQKYEQLAFSVSATTRPRRPNEQDGVHYYFMTPDEFKVLIEEDGFVEWEEVYEDKFYGTLKSEVERLWQADKCIVFDIDVEGAMNIQKMYPSRALTVFVKPPSFQTLVERLSNRQTEDPDSFKNRIQKAKEELLMENKFNRVLVNEILDSTLQEAERMVEAFLKS